MAFSEINEDAKQHINISHYTKSILDHDMLAFHASTLATLINTIITNFYPDALSSISCALKKKQLQWEETLSALTKEEKQQSIALLSQAYTTELLELSTRHSKGVPMKFRINNQNYKHLTTIDKSPHKNIAVTDYSNEDLYYGKENMGSYIKALLEEYATLDYLKREKFYFKDIITQIELAIRSHSVLYLTLNNGKTFSVLPYKITTDNLSTYHYLVSYSLNFENGSKLLSAVSNRISNIICVTISPEQIIPSSKEITSIENEIHQKGPQFMTFETIETIKIKLTQAGIRQFNSSFHLRPIPTTVERDESGDTIYTFQCTTRQIRYYFFKFGADAEILEPVSLRQEFAQRYSIAKEVYQ